MIQALKELGEQKLKMEGREVTDLLSILVQDPNQNGNYPYVLVIIFEKTDGRFKYKHVEVEPTSKEKVKKYLYRRKSSGGADFTPTARITDIRKTFHNKIEGWFNQEAQPGPLTQGLQEAIQQSRDDILKDLVAKWEEVKTSISRGQSGIITIGIETNSKLSYIGDYEVFRGMLIRSVKRGYEKIRKETHICAICGETKEEVYGDALSDKFKFYTLDKFGYIAGGFKKMDAWKNAPICLECSLKIEEGKTFLVEHLEFRLGGQRYFLIPKFILGVDEAKDEIINFFEVATRRQEVLQSKVLKNLSGDENDILQILARLKDILVYNFMFFEYQKGSSTVHRINLLVEDVLPSRISDLFDAKIKAESCQFLQDTQIKMGEQYENIEFRFSNLTRRPPNNIPSLIPSRKNFLEVIDKTFRGVSLDKYLLFSWFMTTIRGIFVKEGYLKPWVLWAFVSLLFFEELGVLPAETSLREGGDFMAELGEKAEKFFSSNRGTFSSSAHKALFLLGVLTQKLLNIQYRERNATPFRKNLKGLRMRESDFQGLLPRIQSKLEEYDKNYYRKLEELISEYLIQAGRGWQMTTDEMNFYFVLGMNLQDKVSQILGIAKEDENYE